MAILHNWFTGDDEPCDPCAEPPQPLTAAQLRVLRDAYAAVGMGEQVQAVERKIAAWERIHGIRATPQAVNDSSVGVC